ncbi:MAG TPA: capsule assembly Wzi family protein [Candidatus Sulfotelmatobacter sp.]|jgi:membrane-associated phospholipid phosphatase|nr:capsule assembly Wzi family protein [Candidatus Sulfotelmatobacter sp.]
MQMRVIVLAFSYAASSLTLTAPFSMSAPPQEQEQRVADSKENSSDTKAEMTPKKKITIDLETEPFENSQPGFSGLGKRFLDDQKQIWTSPAKVRFSDTQWLVPLSGITAGLFVTDVSYSRHLSQNPSTISHYKTLSNASVGALIGGAGGMWLLGHVKHNEHWSETGFLAGEAAINSLVAVEAMKYSLGRQRPFQGDGSGPFFHGGTSFPSEHAAAAWSVAGVIAHEYPGPLTRIMAYGLASLVDYSRIRGRQHFPSDVFVGSIMGNLIAQNIYSRRHDPKLGGGEWRSLSQIFRSDGNSSPANQGSPYVPLDSWIYPALDRLAGMGLIKSAFEGMKPWTRNECIRLLGEAGERVNAGMGGPEAEKIYQLLETEFSNELENAGGEDRVHAKVESVYARVTNVSGQPLTDGNHFGQTITNDFGRLYQEGVNSVEGFSAWTTSGHWVGYIRGEYQHAPSAPADSETTRQFIGSVDGTGIPPATPFSTVNRARLLDTYVGLTFNNWQMSYGKQSLWWSPMQGGPLMFSDNAEPINMFRISRVSPFKLPSILGWLGPIRAEWFLGQLAGHEFVFRTDTGLLGQFGQSISRQPFLQGQKFSFKPTSNLEFSVSLTVIFSGGPTPLTWHFLLQSYSGLPHSKGPVIGDEGDGRSGVDFSYKVPGLRNWLTFYGDAMTEDEISPLGYPRKSAFQGGLYLARIPGIPKLDLRVEGGSTAPVDFPTCQGCFYVNGRYPDGSYINYGNLVGSSLGRAGQGERAWSTYWFSPRDKIQFQYRHLKVNGDYLQRGGTLNDGGVGVEFQLRPQITFSGSLQYENWNFPLLSVEKKSNWTTSAGFTFWPKAWK